MSESGSDLAAPPRVDPLPGAPEAAPSSERADLALFVERNLDKFLPLADPAATRRGGLFICWPGLLFPQAWFLYRKMYGWAAFACVTPLLVSNLHGMGGYGRWLVFMPAFVAIAGRKLYVAGARRTIARIRAASPDEDAARDLLRRAGGVSTAGAIVGGLFLVSTTFIVFKTGFQAGH